MKVDVVLVYVKRNVHAVTTEKPTCRMRCYNANQSGGRERSLPFSFYLCFFIVNAKMERGFVMINQLRHGRVRLQA